MTGWSLGRVRRGLNFVLNQVRGRVAILLYHRIANHVLDPQLLCVRPAHFADHLRHLRAYYQPTSLLQLEQALQMGQVPRKAVVITFDDGYVDNLWYAKPLLEQYDCPATMFVVSGYVGRDSELVSGELERLLLESDTLPERLCLIIAGQTYSWELGATAAQSIAWDITQGHYPTLRHRCYHDLHRLLQPLDQSSRDQVIAELRDWVGYAPPRPERRVMTVDELRELVKGDLITVGAHTISHVLLAAQPSEIQRREIIGSKELLKQILGRSVTAFAYPYGGISAVNSQTVEFVKEGGFSIACDNVPGLVDSRTDPFLLPRYLIRNWPRDEFAQRLRSFFFE